MAHFSIRTFLSRLRRVHHQAGIQRRRRCSDQGRTIEHLEQRTLLSADFGDAPAPYPVTIADNGAQHVATGAFLGAVRDVEADGIPSSAADADGGDEDGVSFGTMQPGQLRCELTVTVQGGAGVLDGWVDFNADGTWGGAEEHIFNSLSLTAGTHTLAFDVPATAQQGVTYARMRLSNSGNLGPGGAADSGEVEDYAVSIVAPAATDLQFASPPAIDRTADGPYTVIAVDMDHDGDMDAVAASYLDSRLRWYENDGEQHFTVHELDSGARFLHAIAADVDGDGDMDVISASWSDNTIAWYENDGQQNFTRQIISGTAAGALSVSAADVDGDGDLDIISGSDNDNSIIWYENDGSQNFSASLVDDAADGPFEVTTADVDGDGDLDLLAALINSDRFVWYENDGSQGFIRRDIDAAADGARGIFPVDLDADGDLDILAVAQDANLISWYENDGNQNFQARTISATARAPTSISAADMDGDGDIDIVTSSSTDDLIGLYVNDGNRNFTATVISSTADGAYDVSVADMDGDRDLDILSAAFFNDTISWYDNRHDDLGDAPAPYPTLRADGGAIHSVNGPWLGASRDVDADGTPSNAADGDGSDDDGVVFGSIRPGSNTAVATVTVSGGDGILDAWVDFNGDGSWNGLGEHIFSNLSVSEGVQTLTFAVPHTAAAGSTYARVRLSISGTDGPGGHALGGEVEDYSVTVQGPESTVASFTSPLTVSASTAGVRSVSAADFDGDGDTDLVSASNTSSTIAWHENDGSQRFSDHIISSNAAGAELVLAADLDGDGDQDVIATSSTDGMVRWYSNDGSAQFTEFELSQVNSPQSLHAGDMDGDGDVDLVVGSWIQDQILLLENDGNQVFTRRTISMIQDGPKSLYTTDLDSDGDLDILAVSSFDHFVIWYENRQSAGFSSHLIANDALGAQSVFATDLDGDGDMDILSASLIDNRIAWYENDGQQSFAMHQVTDAAVGAYRVSAADIDGDGDLDIISASSAVQNNVIAVFLNDGAQNFSLLVLDDALNLVRDVQVVDVDGDGDLDLVGAAGGDNRISWYRNMFEDFGDAPQPYPVTQADTGAMHSAFRLMLGATRDAEADGTNSSNADADGADDDGVLFGSMRPGQSDASVTITVTGGSGRIDAWIDFNRDGVWSGPGEQILKSVNVAPGDNTLYFPVPAAAMAGETVARVRLSESGNLGFVGYATSGEVEDILVSIDSPRSTVRDFRGPEVLSSSAAGVRDAAAVDLDGDGDIDLITAEPQTDSIVWLQNNGAEYFTRFTISATVSGVETVIATDIDGDGDQDIISGSGTTGIVLWHEQVSGGSFLPHAVNTLSGISDLIAVDPDGDGDQDLLIADKGGNRIVLMQNDGKGSFTARVVTTAATGVESIFAVDIDHDGDLDFLSANSLTDQLTWYENDPQQTFPPHVLSSSLTGISHVSAVDLDEDGDLDLLAASPFDASLVWLENDGSQNFTQRLINDEYYGLREAVAADIDGDGDIDIAAMSNAINQEIVLLFLNNGSEQFTKQNVTTALSGTSSLTLLDIDNDGDADLLTTSSGNSSVSLFRNLQDDFGDAPTPYPTTFAERGAMHSAWGPTLGGGRDVDLDGVHSASASGDGNDDGVTFGTLQAGHADSTLTVTVQGGTGYLDAWIDFNADGTWGGPGEQILDRVPVGSGTSTLQFDIPATAISGVTYARVRLSTDGNAGVYGAAVGGEVEDYQVTIVPPQATSAELAAETRIAAGATGIRSLASADADGDGDLDLFAAAAAAGELSWFRNVGHGNFRQILIPGSGTGIQIVVASDIDGDGDIDLVSGAPAAGRISLHLNDGFAQFTTVLITDTAQGVTDLSVCDIDGDGDIDLLGSVSDSDQVILYENNGGATFRSISISNTAAGASSVTSADVDGDGDLDIISGSALDNTVRWFEAVGPRTFVTHSVSTSTIGVSSLFAIDLDRDGDMDILSGSQGSSQLTWHRNDGAQNFSSSTLVSTSAGINSISVADADGDGDPDVYLAAASDNTISLLLNDGNQSFSTFMLSSTAAGASFVLPADIDGDGDLDLFTAAAETGIISWYHNLSDDFGDAPAPYPTLVTAGGAMHSAQGPTLGAARDQESNGTPAADALGDGADEDGVVFAALQPGAAETLLTVNVQGGPAFLDAWIDFNGDGTWGGAGEQIFDSVPVTSGDNLLSFSVPSDAASGVTYARLRLSSTGDLGPGGGAASGEVEDYRVQILSPVASTGTFGGRMISEQAVQAAVVLSTDLDGDGDLDVISGGNTEAAVFWYENDGTGRFTPRSITAAAASTTLIVASDPDGDGDIDLFTASADTGQILWLNNDGSQNFTARTIATVAGISSLSVADINADGELDLAVTSESQNLVAWLEQIDAADFVLHSVSTTDGGAADVIAVDVDADGDLDLIGAAATDGSILLHRNDGFLNFSSETISDTTAEVRRVVAVDLNDDGSTDLVSAAGNSIFWHRNNGGSFTTFLISDQAAGSTGVIAADLDGDGDVDVASSSATGNLLAMYRNDGTAVFSREVISTNTAAASDLAIADIDGDGALDLISAAAAAGEIFWYRNGGDWDPTLDFIADLTILEDSIQQTVTLSGISAGGGESQPLRIIVSSNNPTLIPTPVVDYTSPADTGVLRFTPTPYTSGTAVLTVTVEDGGADGSLATSADNRTFTRTMTVNVTAIRPILISPLTSVNTMYPRIEWTAVPEAVSYQVWIGNSSTGQNPYVRGNSDNTYWDVPTNLGIGKMDLWLRGVRVNGTFLPWTRMQRFTVVTPPVLDDIPTRQETSRPRVTWPAVAGAVEYDIWVNNKSTGETAVIRTTVTDPVWIPTVDLPMGRYHVWVRAIGPGSFYSNWSIRESFYTAPAPELVAPVLPTFETKPTFDWNAVAGATSYGFYLKYLVDGSVSANLNNLTTTAWTPDAALPEGPYAWWVIADSTVAGFRSAWSARQDIYIGGRSTVTAPASPAGSTTPLIEWLQVTGAARYILQVNGDVEGARLIFEENLTGTSFQVTQPLVSGRTYRAWIRAVSAGGKLAPWSSELAFTVANGELQDGETLVALSTASRRALRLLPDRRQGSTATPTQEQPTAELHCLPWNLAEADVVQTSQQQQTDLVSGPELSEQAWPAGWYDEIAALLEA